MSSGAEKESGEAEIFAIGTSVISKGNMALAKENALSQALMKGVEDYLVRRLGSKGVINNFQRIVQEIIPGDRDEIENFHILAEYQTENDYKIFVRLRINKKVIDEKLRGAGLVIMEGPAIKVLFMISETQAGQIRYWWKDPEESSAMGAIELVLHNAFQERGYSPVNRILHIPETEFPEDMKSSDLTDDNLLKWGRLFSADVVIHGRTGIIDDSEMFLTVKAVSAKNGNMLCQSMLEEPIETDPEGNAQTSEALVKLATHLAISMTPAIIQAAGSEHQKIYVLEVTLTGLKTYRQFMDFRDFLRKEVAGVKSVKQTRVRKDSISIEVGFEGNENKFLESVINHEKLPFLLDFSRTEDGKLIFEVE